MIPPKVFISYSHDSANHKQWVLEFATTLRNRGVDAILDQWDLKPGDDLPQFMEQNLEGADFAVMVCTKRYVEKANAGEGGVGYEKMIMTSSSLTKISDNNVVPIIREKCDPKVPTFLKTKLYIDFTKDEDIEYSLDELLRYLLGAPLFTKPEIGSNPFQPLEKARPDRTADGVKEVMIIVSKTYDMSSQEFVYLENVIKMARKIDIPRLKLDRYLEEAIKLRLLRKNANILYMTDVGISYLEEHGIVEF